VHQLVVKRFQRDYGVRFLDQTYGSDEACPAETICRMVMTEGKATLTNKPLHIYFEVQGKVHPITGHKCPEGEWRYSSTLSFTLALDEG